MGSFFCCFFLRVIYTCSMNYVQYTLMNQNIFLVDMTREVSRPFSELMTKWILKLSKQWKKILIINNKKWWSTWLMCYSCWDVPNCTQCDIPIAWHKDDSAQIFWICHICKTHYPKQDICTNCSSQQIKLFWVWNQQIIDLVEELTDSKPLLIDATLANSNKKISRLSSLSEQNIIVWTSLLETWITWFQPDLVCIVSADAWLHSPHYGSKFNNFLFLHWCIQAHSWADFILQSYNSQEQSIISACKGDIKTMKNNELERRKLHQYPPFVQMCVLMYKHEVESSVYTTVHKLYQELLYLREQYEMPDLEIYSTPPTIYKMYWKYRYHIILKWDWLRNFMEIAYSKLKVNSRWFKIDREPISL